MSNKINTRYPKKKICDEIWCFHLTPKRRKYPSLFTSGGSAAESLRSYQSFIHFPLRGRAGTIATWRSENNNKKRGTTPQKKPPISQISNSLFSKCDSLIFFFSFRETTRETPSVLNERLGCLRILEKQCLSDCFPRTAASGLFRPYQGPP